MTRPVVRPIELHLHAAPADDCPGGQRVGGLCLSHTEVQQGIEAQRAHDAVPMGLPVEEVPMGLPVA